MYTIKTKYTNPIKLLSEMQITDCVHKNLKSHHPRSNNTPNFIKRYR